MIFLKKWIVFILVNIFTFGYTVKSSGSSLCPPGKDEYSPNLYDLKTRKCYPFGNGSNGPCNKYSNWYRLNETSELGICSCLSGFCAYPRLHSPIARAEVDGECYPAYQQGPCNKEEWLVYDKNWAGVCRPNPCNNESDDKAPINQQAFERLAQGEKNARPPFWTLHEGKCVRTYTQGGCKTGEVLMFFGSLHKPGCLDPNGSFGCGSTGTSGVQMCSDGYRKHGNDCVPSVEFD